MSTLAGGYSAEKPVDDEVTALFGTPEVRIYLSICVHNDH